nr:arabinofuranosidase catalytic domain-containing protein [Paraburkholderia aspalathi]
MLTGCQRGAPAMPPLIYAALAIGQASNIAGALDGTIGAFEVYDWALRADEVMRHYSAGLGTPPAFIGVLDRLVAAPADAWNLPRLTGGYAGPCINVRRDSDSARQDIGFTPAGDLDVATLFAFVGAGNGPVATWHDQTGHGAPLVQAVAAQQPAIVTAGQLNVLSHGLQPCMTTNGGASGANGQFMQTATQAPSLTFAQPFTRSSVIGVSSMTPQYGNPIVMDSGIDQYAELYESSASTLDMYPYDITGDGGSGFTGLANGYIGVVLETFSQSTSACTFNGVSQTESVCAGGSTMLCLSAAVGSGERCAAMNYSDMIVFGQTLAATDQTLLMASQRAYCGTP